MIGVIADSSELAEIQEFFELFKTPWERYRPGRRYETLLCAGDHAGDFSQAKVILIYAGRQLPCDSRLGLTVACNDVNESSVTFHDVPIPVYGKTVTFSARNDSDIGEERGQAGSSVHIKRFGKTAVVRIGYDLFQQVKYLLSNGQPIRHAGIPTLDLHVAAMRSLLVSEGAVISEIPPVPAGYEFIACLTHDVDHPSIRMHRFDHTAWGFTYRALVGSLVRLFRRRISWGGVLRNWSAVVRLPLIHLGWARDFWHEFDRYHSLECGAPSTFFVIPFKGVPGDRNGRRAPRYRASGYGVEDISSRIKSLQSKGCEIGVHGIDAWHDCTKGRLEADEVGRITGEKSQGVRMHWLYFDNASPKVLEDAGFDYDSTNGYNGTVGYRAGTSQVYKPLETNWLLELPLHVMDTALFYPRHLNLSPAEAKERVRSIVDNAARLGGCITVNWHDRSIMPERLWDDFYFDLVTELKSRGAWVATASQAVAWFRRRRSLVFEGDGWKHPENSGESVVNESQSLPPVQMRIHNSGSTVNAGVARALESAPAAEPSPRPTLVGQ